jgi:hypothetical protein
MALLTEKALVNYEEQEGPSLRPHNNNKHSR